MNHSVVIYRTVLLFRMYTRLAHERRKSDRTEQSRGTELALISVIDMLNNDVQLKQMEGTSKDETRVSDDPEPIGYDR